MSYLFREKRSANLTDYGVPFRGRSGRYPTKRAAMSHSAMWACIDLRAGIISTLPQDTFRKVLNTQVPVAKPPVLVSPGGSEMDITEWMYSTQADLDTCGNTFGLITERDKGNRPGRIDLVQRETVTVKSRDGRISYVIDGKPYEADEVWHEKQYTQAGLAVGLSPLAYAAMTLYQFTAAQEFASATFGGGAVPTGMLRWLGGNVLPDEAEAHKQRFKLAIENGDPFVAGKDWEYKVIDAQAAQSSFIEAMAITDTQICRFFRVPADLVDAASSGSSITYANVTQRNLQFLVLNLGAPIIRREVALSRLLVPGQFVKLNTDALLRMDPQTVATVLGQQVKDRLLAPSEARELMNRQALTPEQIAEFDVLFPKRAPIKEPLIGD